MEGRPAGRPGGLRYLINYYSTAAFSCTRTPRTRTETAVLLIRELAGNWLVIHPSINNNNNNKNLAPMRSGRLLPVSDLAAAGWLADPVQPLVRRCRLARTRSSTRAGKYLVPRRPPNGLFGARSRIGRTLQCLPPRRAAWIITTCRSLLLSSSSSLSSEQS